VGKAYTAVLDLKPYVPYCDAFPTAKAGWVDQISGEEDRLKYWPPPPHLRDTAGGGEEQAPPQAPE